MRGKALDDQERMSLCELVDRVLNKGVVIHGDIAISVADVDLIYLGLRVLLSSIETAAMAGCPLTGGLDARSTMARGN